jgi:hypothetical protein
MFITIYISIWLYSWWILYSNRDDQDIRTTTGVYIWTHITLLMAITGPVGVIVSIVNLMLEGAN